METHEAKRMRTYALTDFQKSALIGTILGDGHILQTTRGYCLRINHGFRQKSLVDWKYTIFRNIVRTPPKIYKKSYYFRSISHPILDEFRRRFYSENKIIPENLVEDIDPIALAVWIMDDGTNELGPQRALRINTQCFTLRENQKLQRILQAKFGIKTTLNRDRNYYRFRIARESMPKLRSLVMPYIIPDMLYKISP